MTQFVEKVEAGDVDWSKRFYCDRYEGIALAEVGVFVILSRCCEFSGATGLL